MVFLKKERQKKNARGSQTYMVSEICGGAWKFFVIWLGAAVSFINDEVDGHFPLQTANVPVAEVIAQFVDLEEGSWRRVQLCCCYCCYCCYCFVSFLKGKILGCRVTFGKSSSAMSSKLSLINECNSWRWGNNRAIVAADIVLQRLPWATSHRKERRNRIGNHWVQTGSPERKIRFDDNIEMLECWTRNSIKICDSIS